MRLAMILILCSMTLASFAQPIDEAPTGFDDKSNGLVDDATHAADLDTFDEIEVIADGLGPLYNAQACRECHQDPTSGGASQVTELRVGHRGPNGRFENPSIPIARGTEVITGRSLVNDRAICPNGTFTDTEIHERVPARENVRTTRLSLNLLGDGFVEAVADQTLIDLAGAQCTSTHGRICGQVLRVPVLEAPGHTGIGRFGWKNQHASLVSLSGDAYVNEMGITSRLFPQEFTNLCNQAVEPNDTPGDDGLDDIEHFARFIRATKAPARDAILAQTAPAKRGAVLFQRIGCAICHVPSLTTAAPGTAINGGLFIIPEALGNKKFYPYGDFLLHNLGTGDGIAVAMPEHYGHHLYMSRYRDFSPSQFQRAMNKIRTAPLWGVRLRTRLMHDGASVTLIDAVLRHRGEAAEVRRRFKTLSVSDQEALLEFLRTL